MTDELDLLWMAMQFKFGFILGLSGWVMALRLGLGWWSGFAQRFLEKLVPADREWIDRILDSRAYRILWVLLNVIASVKLPEIPRKPIP